MEIKWLGHDSFRIKDGKVIYFDPWKIKSKEKADIIFVSHSHYDHFSLDDIEKISKEDTIVIAASDCSGLKGKNKIVEPGDSFEIGGVKVEVIPAYNINKKFHPKENKGVGYVVELDGERIYFAGDTDYIEEMNEIKDIDVALLPVSGIYVMNAEEAAEAANKIMPKLAIPCHFGDIVGEEKDAERFKELCKCKVEILKKEV